MVRLYRPSAFHDRQSRLFGLLRRQGAGFRHQHGLPLNTRQVFAHEALVRGAEGASVRQILIEAALQMCRKLDIRIIAQGIETQGELNTLRETGSCCRASCSPDPPSSPCRRSTSPTDR
ncbi:EAL domain-containing protein [Pseudomonas benzenivorans]|uniref:EAL domain-containing protein n=1 Tax=Pseudomonas benzenivorans TaxID=556533 RepID=A0ABY5H2X6_9PSED|nr:EAL domain-containing protein [Pseudomonas benzenivorans]